MKYIHVRRRVALVEETMNGDTQWAVFEPNDEPLCGTSACQDRTAGQGRD